jgi:hypothetical protein
MPLKPGINEARWMAAGAALLLAVVVTVLHFQKDRSPAREIELKAHRLELVNQIRLELSSAAEAEKSAVMAITDEDSQKLADQARDATAKVEQARQELARLLLPAETNLFSQFTKTFEKSKQIDKELLVLAVQNTNLKAYSLAYGPATAALKDFDAALGRLPTDDARILRLTGTARIAAWRLLALIPPHIAEESDQKMDALEAQMTKEDRTVQQSLEELAALQVLADTADLKTATASYRRFGELRAQILKLSRENTNVRSLTISLSQKRNATALCESALAALQQAIQNEPMSAKPVLPR